MIQIIPQIKGKEPLIRLLVQWSNGKPNTVLLNTDLKNHTNPTLKAAIKEAIKIRFNTNNWVSLNGKSDLTKTDLLHLKKLYIQDIPNKHKDKNKHCAINSLAFILDLNEEKTSKIKAFINKDFNSFKELANAIGYKYLNYGIILINYIFIMNYIKYNIFIIIYN